MRRGGNAILFTAALASAGCVTDTGKLEIRPLADPFTKATKAGSPAVAEGRSMLAMGSVGLAIEAFRKALIQQPDSIEALAGLAECYDQMGRHDLSRAKYEAALAIAPNNGILLRTFAASLERQGLYAEGARLRGEAAEAERVNAAALARMATPAPLAVPAQPAPLSVAAAQPNPVPAPSTVHADQPKPVPAPSTVRVTQPAPVAAPAPARVKIAEVRAPLASASLVAQTEWKIDAPDVASLEVPAAASVTVKLPPATPARVEAARPAAPAPKPVQVAVAAAPLVQAATIATAAPPPADPPRVASAALLRPAAVESEAAKAAPEPRVDLAEAAAASSVTVKLPPPMPAISPAEVPVAPMIKAILPAPAPLKAGPRLERLSLGEVALVTHRRAPWQAEAARWTSISRPLRPAPVTATSTQMGINTSVRFIPLADLQRSYGVRLLNAARHDGLAASTRVTLNRQGWKSVTIGNAQRVREKSLILYSERNEQAARRLAARYGIWIAKEARPGPLTILLGRDWVSRRQARA